MKATDGYTIKALESVTSSDKPGVQIVYKVFGNVNGDISGDNITVLLMGDGSVNGDVKLNHGEVVLIKGNVNGDVKAETLVCPERPEVEETQSSRLATQNISSPQVVHYDETINSNSCESCIHYHPTDSQKYQMYCEHFQRFFLLLSVLVVHLIKGGINYDESNFPCFSYFRGCDSMVLS